MASIVLTGAIAKSVSLVSAIARRSSRFLVTAAAGPSQGNMGEEAPPMSTKEEVTSGQANMATESRGIASAAAGQVADMGDKASHVARDAWGSAKETTEEAADFVSGKAHEAKESIKDNTDAIKRAMNSKSG